MSKSKKTKVNRSTGKRVTERSQSMVKILMNQIGQKITDITQDVLSGKVQIHSKTEMYNIPTLVSMVKQGHIYVDPDMKRGYVWDEAMASRLIESLLTGYALPPIFVADDGNGKLLLIDGYNRLMTILRFMENELALTGEGIPILKGKKYSDLPPEYVAKLQTVAVPVTVVTIITDDPMVRRLIIFDMFRKMNINTRPLLPSQVLFCSLNTPPIMMVKRLADNELTKLVEFNGREIQLMTHRILILLLGTCIKKNKFITLTRAARKAIIYEDIVDFILNTNEEETKQIEQKIRDVLEVAQAFGLSRRDFVPKTYGISKAAVISRPIFNSIMYLLHELIQQYGKDNVIANKDKILAAIRNYFMLNDEVKELHKKAMTSGSLKHLDKLYSGLREVVIKALSAS